MPITMSLTVQHGSLGPMRLAQSNLSPRVEGRSVGEHGRIDGEHIVRDLGIVTAKIEWVYVERQARHQGDGGVSVPMGLRSPA